jgi:hypothetical protein
MPMKEGICAVTDIVLLPPAPGHFSLSYSLALACGATRHAGAGAEHWPSASFVERGFFIARLIWRG